MARKLISTLRVAASEIALVGMLAATSVSAQTSPAPQASPKPDQGAASQSDDSADIIVTGSSLRGVAPIGSNLVSIDRDAMERTAAINATELTNSLPSISTAGSAPVGENVFSYFSPQIHSLGGSASNTTLVIVDGLRMPGGGVQYAQTDPNIIPTSAIQRVEVLADGASSVYGSDAVAGVVNYITRRTFDGAEMGAKIGFGDSWHSVDANGIVGKNWGTGGVYVAAQYSYQSPLSNISRDFLSRGDYRAVGGRNVQSFNCSPATIRTPLSGANTYLSPSATTTVASSADNSPCNTSIYGDALPSNTRGTILARVTNTFGGNFTTTGTINYSRLNGSRALGPGTVSSVTVFGPNSGRGGQINPFFVAPAGEPGATQEFVSYAAIRPDNKYGTQDTENDTLYLYGTAEYRATDTLSVKLSGAYGHSRSGLISRNIFCGACANLALNGTALTSGSTTASNVGGANIIALNLPLTTANALDVWRANGGLTSPAVFDQLYSNDTSLVHVNDFFQAKLEGQAAPFALPAGDVRIAIGGEYFTTRQHVESVDPLNTGNTIKGSAYLEYLLKRNVYSAYAEVVVPLISPEMAVPLVRKLEINLSGRYDRYNDVGSTTNPKIAANWQVANGVRFRGNYATSFVAPALGAIGAPTVGYQRTLAGASASIPINVPVSRYPEVTQVPGCATATVSCQIGGALNQGLLRSFGVGPDAKPQTGSSWSVGLDLDPPFLPGLTANFTFWSNTLKGGINRPEVSQILNSAVLHDRLTICPTGCSAAQINQFTNVANGGTPGTLPTTSYFLLRLDSGNLLNLHVQGIDASIVYRIEADRAGTFTIGGSGTYYTKYMQDYGDTPFSVLNTSGYNSTFPSIQQRYRFQGGWELGDFSTDVFLNYTGSYRNWSSTSLAPVTTTPAGIPTGGGDLVKANTTIDLHAEYRFATSFMKQGSIYLDVKNLLDEDPPFYGGNTSGIGLSGYGYNGYVSNPIGRIISVGVRAGF